MSAPDVNWKFVDAGIDVVNCPLVSPPPAIANQGHGATRTTSANGTRPVSITCTKQRC